MKKIVQIILVLVISFSLTACENNTAGKGLIIAAKYPEMPKYPIESNFKKENGDFDDEGFDKAYDVWKKFIQNKNDVPKTYDLGIKEFSKKSIAEILKGNPQENHVYSPANLYIALSMLSDISDGNSRKEILDLIGSKNIDEARERARSIWNVLYMNDGATTSIFANSLWLNEKLSFKKEGLDSLAENYFASSYKGKMGSDEFNKELRNWINEQTGGLLKKQASGIEMESSTVLTLASTVYYKDKWENTFGNSTKDIFHSAKGDTETEFMSQREEGSYYYSEKFSAVAQDFESGNDMLFILPDEGFTPNDLLEDENLLKLLFSNKDWNDVKYLMINKKIPKFDIVSDKKLVENLKNLGINDVFDSSKSDFSPILNDMDGYISKIAHAARVKIDEKGCEAAAYTVITSESLAVRPPDEEVDFILNRPFIFVIRGKDNIPMFIGVVNICNEE